MKAYQYGPTVTIEAGEALTKRRFVDNQGKHTVDIRPIGVTLFDTDSGDQATIQVSGIAVVEAGGAITVGTHPFVSMDADGKAVASAGHDATVGAVPLDSATAAGQFIRVRLI